MEPSRGFGAMHKPPLMPHPQRGRKGHADLISRVLQDEAEDCTPCRSPLDMTRLDEKSANSKRGGRKLLP